MTHNSLWPLFTFLFLYACALTAPGSRISHASQGSLPTATGSEYIHEHGGCTGHPTGNDQFVKRLLHSTESMGIITARAAVADLSSDFRTGSGYPFANEGYEITFGSKSTYILHVPGLNGVYFTDECRWAHWRKSSGISAPGMG